MVAAPEPMRENAKSDLEKAAAAPEPGIITEFRHFLRTNKKWRLLPIIVAVLLLLGLLVVMPSSGTPLIYTLY